MRSRGAGVGEGTLLNYVFVACRIGGGHSDGWRRRDGVWEPAGHAEPRGVGWRHVVFVLTVTVAGGRRGARVAAGRPRSGDARWRHCRQGGCEAEETAEQDDFHEFPAGGDGADLPEDALSRRVREGTAGSALQSDGGESSGEEKSSRADDNWTPQRAHEPAYLSTLLSLYIVII